MILLRLAEHQECENETNLVTIVCKRKKGTVPATGNGESEKDEKTEYRQSFF